MDNQDAARGPDETERNEYGHSGAWNAAALAGLAVGPASIVPIGTVLGGRYAVNGIFPRHTRASELYLCAWRSRPFVAKVYGEGTGFTKEAANVLTQVTSPYVARILKAGQWENHPFQVSPYFRNGSLEGRTFDAETICRDIVPQMNRGLSALHARGIVHGRLRPSNIMLGDAPDRYLIADYGTFLAGDPAVHDLVEASSAQNQHEVSYDAPEMVSGKPVAASDYYSLGVTLFVLYTGQLPIELPRTLDVLAPRFDFPSDMPKRLRNLIIDLTHSDLSNQTNYANPNRRWTYAEVRRWCAGDTLPVPVESFGPGAAIPPYTFMDRQYTSVGSLVAAMAVHWEEGKRHLLSGIMREFFEASDPVLARNCERAEAAARVHPEAADAVYLEYLYRLSPDLQNLYWKGECLGTADDVGMLFLRDSVTPQMANMTEQAALSGYMRARYENEPYLARAMANAERDYADARTTAAQRAVARRVLSRLLSEDFQLTVDEESFEDIAELVEYCLELHREDREAWEELSSRLVPQPGQLEPTFEAWLRALGKDDAIVSWSSGRGHRSKTEPGIALREAGSHVVNGSAG